MKTTPEAAKELKISGARVRLLVQQGRLVGRKQRCCQTHLITEASIRQYKRQRQARLAGRLAQLNTKEE